ncbi:TonB-dependent siderophore receptor [Phyllobacterium phragmitis]|uniref:TonB-dependent siderophore receptor n=1 Tax=Phyllobacterium phragmitis TaxID=2670329 RepID=UPI001FDED021|nr:TonB-dependent siderophore receptor [Phyllobacterium phragmitis]
MNRTSLPFVFSTVLMSFPALAQNAESQDRSVGSGEVIQLDTITINTLDTIPGTFSADGYVVKSGTTATKTNTPLNEIPQSISYVTQQELQDRNPQSLMDSIAYVPGVRVDSFGFDPRMDSYYVRGFDAYANGTFRDGLRQMAVSTSFYKTEPYGLEGVSVLKGPSSALYGGTSAGGLINLITKRPTDTPLNEIELQYGSRNRYQTNFDFSGPATADGGVLYRMTGVLRDSDTELMGTPDDRVYLAPAITWKPDEDTKLTILAEYMRFLTGGAVVNYNDPNGRTDFFYSDPNYNDFDQEQGRIGYEFEHRFNDTLQLRQSFRYSRTNLDLKYAYIDSGQYASGPDIPDQLTRGTGHYLETLDNVVVDNQLQADFSTGPVNHTLLAGIDASYAKFDEESGFGVAPPLDTANPNYGSQPIENPATTPSRTQKLSSIGVYLQDQIKYDAWVLTLGGRYDWYTAESVSLGWVAEGQEPVEKRSDGDFSGRVGLTYLTDFGLAPYVSYSTAFVPNLGWDANTGSLFEATTAEQQEIGVKYDVPGLNASVTASLFNIEQTNGVYYEVVDGRNQQIQSDRRSRGFEIEGSATLDNGLNLRASYTYLDMRILDDTAGIQGNTASSTPRNVVKLWGDYSFVSGPLTGLGAGLGARFVGSSFGDNQNSFKNDARVFLDASMHYDLEALNPKLKGARLQINATNLLDEDDDICTNGYCYVDQGRTVIASLRYRW